MSGNVQIGLTINGALHVGEAAPRMLLVDYIRDVVGLKGTRYGCDTSNCGSCTVVMDGRSAKSCTFLAVQAHGRDVTTIEGLADGSELNPLQAAFQETHALQCGFCTSGMVMSAHALLSRNPDPSPEEIREGIIGNLCRCTGYLPVVEAVQSAARRLKADEEGTNQRKPNEEKADEPKAEGGTP